MKQLTRRELLRGMGACSALALLGPLGRAATEWPPENAAQSITQLNVLIHGVFVIDVESGEIVLYPPIVSSHVFEAGNTGAERRLSKGMTYSLDGVNKSNPRPSLTDLHPDDNGVFHRHTVVQSDCFCKVVLPFPDEIVPLRLTPIPRRDYFQGSPSPYQQPSFIADLNVFRYTATGPLSLKPLAWTPRAHNGIANLQLIAMPNGPVSASHAPQAFQSMANAMGYPKLTPNASYANTAPPPPSTSSVPGVNVSDENGLPERASARSHASGQVHVLYNSALDCLSLFMY